MAKCRVFAKSTLQFASLRPGEVRPEAQRSSGRPEHGGGWCRVCILLSGSGVAAPGGRGVGQGRGQDASAALP